HQHACLSHLFFMRTQNLAEIVDLVVHAIEHHAHGIDFYFSAFKTLQSEADGQMLGKLDENGFVRLVAGSLCGRGCYGLFERLSVCPGELCHLVLESGGRGNSSLAFSDTPETGEGAEYPKNLVFGSLTVFAAPCSPLGPMATGTCTFRASFCEAGHHAGDRDCAASASACASANAAWACA